MQLNQEETYVCFSWSQISFLDFESLYFFLDLDKNTTYMSIYVFYTCKDNCGCYCILKTYLLKILFKKKYFRHF